MSERFGVTCHKTGQVNMISMIIFRWLGISGKDINFCRRGSSIGSYVACWTRPRPYQGRWTSRLLGNSERILAVACFASMFDLKFTCWSLSLQSSICSDMRIFTKRGAIAHMYILFLREKFWSDNVDVRRKFDDLAVGQVSLLYERSGLFKKAIDYMLSPYA